MAVPVFKLVIVGSEGVGKHSFVDQFVRCQTSATPCPNVDIPATIHTLPLTTNLGVIEFQVWVANKGVSQSTQGENGYDVPKSLPDAFYVGSHAAIVMFDVTARQSYREIPIWFRDVARVCDSIPIVLVGNKNDSVDRQVKAKMITFHRKKNLQYYDISTKAQYRILDPLLWLFKRLIGDPTIQLLDAELVAPEINVLSLRALYEELEEQLHQACNMPLYEDDDQ